MDLNESSLLLGQTDYDDFEQLSMPLQAGDQGRNQHSSEREIGAPHAPASSASKEAEAVTTEAATTTAIATQPNESESQDTPLVSIDAPVVVDVIAESEVPPQQQPVTVFAPAATVRSVAGSTVLEITPERQAITVRPSDAAGDRVASWRSQLRNDLIQPVMTDGYRGVPAPPSSRFRAKHGTKRVATTSDRSDLEALFLAPNYASNGSIVYPLNQVVPITSGFGWRSHPISGNVRFHAGIDLGAPYGTPVLAVLPGQVVAVGDAGGYGLRIVLQHGNRLQTLYAHLSQAFVKVGDVVQLGQSIGRVGASGYATGPHLHLEVIQLTANGWQAVDFRLHLEAAANNLRYGIQSSPITQQPLSDPEAPILRVALGRQLGNVRIASSTPAWVLDAQRRPIAVLEGMRSLVAVPTARGIQVGTFTFPTVFFIQPSNNGAVAVGDRWYRGKLMVASLPDGLVVVNWVDIESYLYSVVGSESYPSWGQEALKAQAIAARTYALKIRTEEPASVWYDLDDTPRYQRYRGIETEFQSTIQAVVATRFQVLVNSWSGTLVLSEYAATQEIVNSVHRGYGMAQWGAASLARQGFEYSQILRHYYPNTSLTTIRSQY